MQNISGFKALSKELIVKLLNDFPNQSMLFYDDFAKECEVCKIDFNSCVYFLKECKVLKYEKENKMGFINTLLSPRAYLYFSKNDLKDIDDLIEFCIN
ncbi:hypothetical protein [Campylobacter lari]|uniref:hypothetical protein n=1 Tax=Campylobacter lari TaxID=201 RepID=UPI001C7D90C2|nr:hypothetical protein [Campylobacter lari]MBX2683007.1 hypothetical protein [Campylobacter lari]